MSHTFYTFWMGKLSPREWICINSFLQKGHSYRIFSYDHKLSIPTGAELLNANDIVTKKEYDFHVSLKGTNLASFSDKFRYKLLLTHGGWWVDTDVVCLKNEIPISDFQTFMCWQHHEKINNAIIRMGVNDPIMKKCLEEIEKWEEYAKTKKCKLSQGQFGPHLITEITKNLNRFAEVFPMRYGYPWHWTEAKSIFATKHWDLNLLIAKTEDSYFGHLWNDILNKEKIEKNFQGDPGCYWRNLVEMHINQDMIMHFNWQ